MRNENADIMFNAFFIALHFKNLEVKLFQNNLK
jgi:hypothetical protein